MKKVTMSYKELAEKVGDMVLFNNHSQYEVDKDWVYGLIEQPLMRERLDELDELAAADGIEDTMHSVIDFDIYQSFAITQFGAQFLINHTAELVSYSEKLDLWFWHIGHYGTSWSGVHTEVTYLEGDDYDNITLYQTHEEMTSLIYG